MTTEPNHIMPQQASDRQRLTFIFQEQGFVADWEFSDLPFEPWLIQFQHELHAAFSRDPDFALFDLAFRDRTEDLAESCRFLAQIARCFVEQLALRPERNFCGKD
jgi:hypothetical protein